MESKRGCDSKILNTDLSVEVAGRWYEKCNESSGLSLKQTGEFEFLCALNRTQE